MSADTWVRVRERVLRLAEHPRADKVFGARGHGFRLGPVMGEEQIRALEADLGVGLPEQYRSFLLRVGGGGAGPYYGLMTSVLGEGGWQWLGIGLRCAAQPTTAEFAGRPFVAEVLQRELAALETREPAQEAFADDDEFRRAYAAWDARYGELDDAREAGAVFLSEQGCGFTSVMVMAGPHRGAIWDDRRPVDGGIVPTGHYFAYWYRSWLERTEQQLAFTAAPSHQGETL
ncbi:SMI1/KNR4 family protein [Streptomyces sp. NPDC085524]|uniref:SMI1/KNR4 family protein n=1 Tax=Streptomyces sp. NPDC085524 TaxID=3365728 RepID=UPI0037D3DB12